MIQEIEISRLKVHPNNVRKTYNDIEELAESIKAQGILQNLTVVPDPQEPGTYLTVIGNRRLTAAKLAGIKTAPCQISDMDEKEQASVMLLENMQRNDLTIYEEAQGFQMMLDFGETEATIAEKTGLSRTTVRHRLNIAKLDQEQLKEREADGEFQLSLKDLYALEKVEDIEERNRILREARDSRDLAWKAQSAATEAKRKANAEKVVGMLEEKGVTRAPEKASTEIYSGKWETVDTIDLDKELPESVEVATDDTLYYLSYYREIKIIRKSKKVQREETEEDRKRKQRDANKKKIKEICGEMEAERRDFVLNIISGKVEKINDTAEITKMLWEICVDRQAVLHKDNFVRVYVGSKDRWSKTQEDRETAAEWVSNLDMYEELLITALCACAGIELTEWDGKFDADDADILKRFYIVLAMYGLHVDDEEQKKVLDGTHECYADSEPDSEEA